MTNRYIFEFVFGTLLEEDRYYPDIKRLLSLLARNGYNLPAENNKPWILSSLLVSRIQGDFEKKWSQYADEEIRGILGRLADDYFSFEKAREEKEREDVRPRDADTEPIFFDI